MNESCNALLSAVRHTLRMTDLPLDVQGGCGDGTYKGRSCGWAFLTAEWQEGEFALSHYIRWLVTPPTPPHLTMQYHVVGFLASFCGIPSAGAFKHLCLCPRRR